MGASVLPQLRASVGVTPGWAVVVEGAVEHVSTGPYGPDGSRIRVIVFSGTPESAIAFARNRYRHEDYEQNVLVSLTKDQSTQAKRLRIRPQAAFGQTEYFTLHDFREIGGSEDR